MEFDLKDYIYLVLSFLIAILVSFGFFKFHCKKFCLINLKIW